MTKYAGIKDYSEEWALAGALAKFLTYAAWWAVTIHFVVKYW